MLREPVLKALRLPGVRKQSVESGHKTSSGAPVTAGKGPIKCEDYARMRIAVSDSLKRKRPVVRDILRDDRPAFPLSHREDDLIRHPPQVETFGDRFHVMASPA
jgi:hypothetical protein